MGLIAAVPAVPSEKGFTRAMEQIYTMPSRSAIVRPPSAGCLRAWRGAAVEKPTCGSSLRNAPTTPAPLAPSVPSASVCSCRLAMRLSVCRLPFRLQAVNRTSSKQRIVALSADRFGDCREPARGRKAVNTD